MAGEKENTGNSWPDSLISVPANNMEQILLEDMSQHMEKR